MSEFEATASPADEVTPARADHTRPSTRRPKPSAPGPRSPRGTALRLGGHTIKNYRLGDDAANTVSRLRRIFNQKTLPDDATVALAEQSVTIEWEE